MEYIIENEVLKVTVTSRGAQVISVVHKADGVEHIWCGDPAVWGGRAPVMFPYAGKLKDGKFTARGKEYTGNQHGFARNMEHTFVSNTGTQLTLELPWSEETYALWPYKFCLRSVFTLRGDTLHHALEVENRDDEDILFGVGYHPGFNVPFDGAHSYTDYEFRFDALESPMYLDTSCGGLVSDKHHIFAKNIKAIPLTDTLFDNDSLCMTGLHSSTLGLYEKGSNRAIICNIEAFPYTLIWSKPGVPKFVCIEPWQSIPSRVDDGHAWEEKAAAASAAPGEIWSTCLTTQFRR